MPRVVTGSGAGHIPRVRAFAGASTSPTAGFLADDPRFTAGVFVAVGRLAGLGDPQIITGAGQGRAPDVGSL